MSFSAEIEHIYAPPELLPLTLRAIFSKGVCAVWASPEDESIEPQLVAAIPATNDQTAELADLMEIAAIALTGDDAAYVAYCKMRDELCQPLGYQRCSILFRQEMEKVQAYDDRPTDKYNALASAHVPKASELN